jgi:hypothetical protein
VYADWGTTKAEFNNNRFVLMSALGLKTFVDVLGVTKSLGLLLETIGKPLTIDGANLISRGLAVEFLGIRVLAILMTWEAMVAITLLQIVVAWISDDDLQVWCNKCVFGTSPLNRSLSEQNKALEAAIKDIS